MRVVIIFNTTHDHRAWAGTVVRHPANCLPFCKRGHEPSPGDVLETVSGPPSRAPFHGILTTSRKLDGFISPFLIMRKRRLRKGQ